MIEEIKDEDKKDEKVKVTKEKGSHIKKSYLIFPLVGLLIIIIFNIFKSPSNTHTENKTTEKSDKTLTNTTKIPNDLGFELTYKSQKKGEGEFPIDNYNVKKESETSLTTVTKGESRELTDEEREILRKLKEEAGQAKKSPVAFVRQNGQGNSTPAYSEQSKTYHDYDENRQGSKKNFLQNESSNEFTLRSSLQGSVSPYEIKAGDFIPAIAITAINSDLPAKVITAQIRENIYDTISGKFLLIPQGTRVIGTYDSNVSWGQNRLLVVWQRMIFPNGNSINLHNMQGVDLTGQAGITGKVNNHFGTLLKGVLLSSAMGATAAIVTDNGDADWRTEAGKGAGEVIVEVGNKFAEKALNRQPTIEIKSGERFNIMVHSDLILKPYKR